MRYFIQFSYFGKHYHGWQIQPNAITVQEVLENKMSKLIGEAIKLTGAGRTDAGVHAKQMFAHFNTLVEFEIEEFIYRLNSFLPDDISVLGVFKSTDDGHARFDAQERTYEYWVTIKKDPFLLDNAHYVKHKLNVDAMNLAAQLLLHHTNFECFSKSNTQVNTFNCDVKQAGWQQKEDCLVFTITADRFLRNMVRAIVGTLLEVGTGKLNIDDIQEILNSKDRSRAGVSVPAQGLYLTRVKYPTHIFV